jgi:hypothetical protein
MILLSSILFCVNLFAQNPFGKVLYLNGKNFVEVPDDPSLNFDNHFTFEFWLRPNDYRPFGMINKLKAFYADHRPTLYQGWSIELNRLITSDPDIVPSTPGNMQFLLQASDSTSMSVEKDIKLRFIESELWQHRAISLGHDENKAYSSYYKNGKYNKGRSFYQNYYISTPGCSLNIGGLYVDIDSTLCFNGLIDEVRIWNRTRTEVQIQSTWDDTLSHEYYSSPDSGLVAYYRFDKLENLGIGDDGLVDDIRDYSFYANHADINTIASLVDSDILAAVDIEKPDIPVSFGFLQNYPNPFNPVTTISYNLPKSDFVTLKVYDILGQEIETLVEERQQSGVYKVAWNAKELPSGLYICYLKTEGFVRTIKMLLQK